MIQIINSLKIEPSQECCNSWTNATYIILSMRCLTTISYLGTPESTSAPNLGHFRHEITNKENKDEKNVALNTSSSFVTRGPSTYDFILGIWAWGEIFWDADWWKRFLPQIRIDTWRDTCLFFNQMLLGLQHMLPRSVAAILLSKRGRDYRVMLLSQGDGEKQPYHQGFLMTLWNFWRNPQDHIKSLWTS